MDTRAKLLAAGLILSGIVNILAIGFIAWHYGLGSFAGAAEHEAQLLEQRESLESEHRETLAEAVEAAREEGIAVGRSRAASSPPKPTPSEPAPTEPTPRVPSTPTSDFPVVVRTDHGYPIETEYDEFDDDSTISVEIEDLRDSVTGGGIFGVRGLELWIFDVFDGRQRESAPTGVMMRILVRGSSSSSWRYIDCHSLSVLADEHRFSPRTEWDGSVGTDLEFIYSSWQIADFLKIANSASIRMKLCNTEMNLSENQVAAIRDFAARLKPQP